MIYLDYASTTPVCPESVNAVVQAMTEDFGNPSSRHRFGAIATDQLNQRRATVATAVGCQVDELFFTASGTESNNWALHIATTLGRRTGKHIITSSIEHAAMLEPLKTLEMSGYTITRIKPDRTGHINPQDVVDALRPDTALVSVMLVNNEIGTVQPVAAIAQAMKATQSTALLHCDAIQGFLKIPFTPKELGVDLLTISGHKIGAPKGIGALYIRRGINAPALIGGGGQERGLRSGTEATAQIAGFAAACAARQATWREEAALMTALKEHLLEKLSAITPPIYPVVASEAPHICAITLPGYKSEVLVRYLSDLDVCVSAGSACHKGRPSHVFAALGLSKKQADGTLRVSFAHQTTVEEVDALVDALQQAQKNLFTTLS